MSRKVGSIAMAAAVVALMGGMLTVRAPSNARTLLGEPVALGNGSARTYLVVENGAPVELGVALTREALANLPAGDAAHPHDMEKNMFRYTLKLPEGNPTPFRFVDLGWNPLGHEPPGLYDTPHFDFHFYVTEPGLRNEIDPADPLFQTKAARYPRPEYIPAGYVAPEPLAIPQMGVHWIDPKSGEFNGKGFTTTFLFGSWNSQVIFAEPMITKKFIEETRDFSAPVALAEKYEVAGYYPSSYRVYRDDRSGEYRVALTNLVKK